MVQSTFTAQTSEAVFSSSLVLLCHHHIDPSLSCFPSQISALSLNSHDSLHFTASDLLTSSHQPLIMSEEETVSRYLLCQVVETQASNLLGLRNWRETLT